MQSPDRTHGHEIGHGEQGGEGPSPAQQLRGSDAAPVGGKIDGGVVLLRVDGKTVGGHGIQHTLPAGGTGVGVGPVTADHGDPFVAQGDQRLHGLGRGLSVVDADAGKIREIQLLGAVGDDHAGDAQAFEICPEILPVATQEDDAQGLFLLDQGPGPAHLVVRAVDVVHMEGVAGAVEQILDDLHHLGEEGVARALDDEQNGGGVGLLELLGVDVELKAAFLHGGQNGGASLLADIGVVVEHTGHGADSVAGFGRKILDGHIRHPFPKDIPAKPEK